MRIYLVSEFAAPILVIVVALQGDDQRDHELRFALFVACRTNVQVLVFLRNVHDLQSVFGLHFVLAAASWQASIVPRPDDRRPRVASENGTGQVGGGGHRRFDDRLILDDLRRGCGICCDNVA